MKKQLKTLILLLSITLVIQKLIIYKGIALMNLGYIQEAIENYNLAIKYR
ncbi:tetratricopeptide repeat with 9 trp repeats domain protein, partial [Orientia tsutsugamushi str. Gilliam]